MPGVTAEALRREFDEAFARPVRERSVDHVALLSIRVAGQPYALRIDELGGVAAGRRITPVPSSDAAFAGLVGIRGALFAVHDLAALLGVPRREHARRWVALTTGEGRLALAFAELEGHLRLPAAAFGASESGDGLCAYAIRADATLRPVVSIPRVFKLILDRAARERPGKSDESDG
jgi:chemotaxis signal transduction protein